MTRFSSLSVKRPTGLEPAPCGLEGHRSKAKHRFWTQGNEASVSGNQPPKESLHAGTPWLRGCNFAHWILRKNGRFPFELRAQETLLLHDN